LFFLRGIPARPSPDHVDVLGLSDNQAREGGVGKEEEGEVWREKRSRERDETAGQVDDVW